MRVSMMAATFLALASAAVAKDFGEHGGYQVVAIEGTSPEDRGGCVMAEDDFEGPGGTRLRLFRYVKEPDLIAVIIDNYNWTSKNDEEYELEYRFDKYFYARTGIGTVDGIHHGFMAIFPFSDFAETFAKSSRLHVYRGDTVVDKLLLDGSAEGLSAFDRCWRYVLADDAAKARERARWKDIPKDPFAVPQPKTGEKRD